jgi:chlorite dismutase
MQNNVFDFIGGSSGQWEVMKMSVRIGEPLAEVSHLSKLASSLEATQTGIWTLKGFTSNLRYTEKEEKQQLVSVQEDLNRPRATCAAMIPMRKSEAWWAMAQDERRAIFEKQSAHTETGLKYLPAIARKLFHCRDIGQPFDFITWFEYAPEHSDFFEDLVANLRKTLEWTYVDREVDFRLRKVL